MRSFFAIAKQSIFDSARNFCSATCLVTNSWRQSRSAHTNIASSERRGRMDDLCRYSGRPFAFIFRYVRRRAISHGVILAAVLAAVGCSITTQYGVKYLVDALSGADRGNGVWLAFALLVSLIAADNLLWRIAGFTMSSAFVRVTGDLRRDLFGHLTGHSPTYFANRLPGMLTARVTATSNAVFTVESMFIWNVVPACASMLGAIALITIVSVPMALTLAAIGSVVVVAMFHFAAAGKPLHHAFADKAAAVDGEMVDVIGNLPLVRAFCGTPPRASPLRNHGRSRAERAPAQPLVSRAAAPRACGGDGRAHRRPARLGDPAVAAGPHLDRRRRARLHARPHGAACDARSCRGAGRRHAASGATVGSALDPAGAARFARPSAGRAAARFRRQRAVAERHLRLPGQRETVRQSQPADRAGPARRAGRPIRRRQVDAVRAAAAALRRGARRHLHRRPGHHARHAGKPARRDRGGAAGRLAVPPLRDGEHPLRPAGRARHRGLQRGARGALSRFHRGDAERHGNDRRRPRHEALRRAAPAHRDRARAA